MALAFASTNKLHADEAGLTRRITLTVTGDGSAVSADASLAHGGPAGATPSNVSWKLTADSATGGEIPSVAIVGYDATNDEVDITFTSAAAIANTETIEIELDVKFDQVAAQDGSSISQSAVY